MAPKYSLAELRNLQEDDELDLSACGISEFPKSIVQLNRLTNLDLSSNLIFLLPKEFCKMTRIIRLDFGNNQLHHLPDEIGLLSNLQHLNLYNNKIEDLPLSFANLKSLKWLDLKKNPLNPKLAEIAGNCGTDAECKKAARQVVEVYMGEKMKKVTALKAQEEKLKAKVQKAQEEEKIRKYQEKKSKENGKKEEKEAKQREAALKHHHQQQQHQNHQNSQPKKSTKNSTASPKNSADKNQKKPRGFFGKLFGFAWSVIFYLTIAVFTSATIAIALDCKGLGTKIPGTAPLCKDLSTIGGGSKPSAAFATNVKNAYSKVFTGYHAQLKPHVAPIQSSISAQYKKFAKTDIGGKVEKIVYNIHSWIVDTWVKVQRFVIQQWNALSAWWKKDGQKQFGPALEGFKMGLKMVYNVVLDVLHNVAAVVVHLATRVKTFFVAWTEGGFNAAMKTLNH